MPFPSGADRTRRPLQLSSIEGTEIAAHRRSFALFEVPA
jgi:hypothetical protein